MVKYYSFQTGIAIVRVSKDFYKKAWTALFFLTALKKKNCSLNVLHTSGTIKLLQKKAIELDLKEIRRLRLGNKINLKKAEALSVKNAREIMEIS